MHEVIDYRAIRHRSSEGFKLQKHAESLNDLKNHWRSFLYTLELFDILLGQDAVLLMHQESLQKYELITIQIYRE
jgi:hypothetical protein